MFRQLEQLNYGIIDCHVNVGKYIYIDLPENDTWDTFETAHLLLGNCDRFKIEAALVCNFESIFYNPSIGNAALSTIQQQTSGRLIGLATVHPLLKSAPSDLLHAIDVLKLHGLKLHPSYQRFTPTDSRVQPLFELCGAHNAPVMFHCGTTQASCHPEILAKVAQQHPKCTFIFAHMGGTNVHLTAEAIRKLDNVYLETSVSRPVFDPIRSVANRIGIGRLLFGSDFPCGSIQLELFRIFDAGFTDEELRLVLRDNFLSLFKRCGKLSFL
jgi:predicted TIM-barrel fold metal-dependent hydrolase